MEESKRINQLFTNNPKAVYRTFKSGPSVRVKDPPSQEDINSFWKGIWGCDVSFNEEADWLNVLKQEYCTNVTPKKYELSPAVFKKVLKKLANNRTPGIALIIGVWIKYTTSVHPWLIELYIRTKLGEIDFLA